MDQESLIRYILGDASPEEKNAVAEWLDEDTEHMREFLAYRKLYDVTIWQLDSNDIPINNQSEVRTEFTLRRLIFESLKVAAIFVVALLGVRYFLPSLRVNEPIAMQTIHVPAGQRTELILTDGTKVWLNSKSTFSFPNIFSEKNRNVSLDGEGYFDVTNNKKQPFIVSTLKYDIKVWGTQFNVIAYSASNIFETSLLKGSIELLNPGTDKGVLILPNERIFLNADHLVRAPISNYNHFLWKDGIISFDNESFPEMITKLELYFDLQIINKNKTILRNRYTGKFRTKDGVEHILKVLQLSNRFRYKIDDKFNIITIE